VRVRPYGDTAALVEFDGLDEVLGLYRELTARDRPGVVSLVPSSRTLLVQVDPQVTSVAAVVSDLEGSGPPADQPRHAGPVEIPVTYDGEDLEEVGELTGLGARGVVEAHTDQIWTVGFVGFAPGFGYLVGEDRRLEVPRRAEPRSAVPVGAVGLADEYSGVYPRRSPGGWQLIGRTEVAMWDLDRDPPALLAPGAEVRFVEAP
jgi:KipI family sensor histidine kinase inhibitor